MSSKGLSLGIRLSKVFPGHTNIHVSRRFYRILRPWSSANCPPSVDVFETESLIDEYSSQPLNLKNILIFNKRTRYEFEKMLANRQTEAEFRNYMRQLGSDYNKLREQHELHQRNMTAVVDFLQKKHVNVTIAGRSSIDAETLSQVDAVITTGGDGTFLQAASSMENNHCPIIGINTDPYRSQGQLCLPNITLEEIYQRLITGQFRWLHRQRIQVSLSLTNTLEVTDLHTPGRPSYDYPISALRPDPEEEGFVCLPMLGLNEVFVGENSNAITAYYELGFDGEESFKQKSSGLTLSTGTGSTSWYHTIASLHPDTVRLVLLLANTMAARAGYTSALPVNDHEYVKTVCQTYNAKLQFHPEEPRMAFAARDPIVNEVYELTPPRGFCKSVRIRSRMQDGSLVIDGGFGYSFSMGSEAIIRVAKPDQALRTVSFFKPCDRRVID